MKKNYLFFLFILICLKFQGQTKCSEADSDVIYAYSDVKTSYEANNISHLKEYAYKSLLAFKRALPKLKDCGCETSYNHAFDAIDLFVCLVANCVCFKGSLSVFILLLFRLLIILFFSLSKIQT